ncbi:MAG: MOSC N-terminal beta barrel domain-containing protein [Polyangiaceae bacterium]
MPVVSALYVYPIKSCRGIRVDEWPIAERGFVADRRWMVVDAAGKVVTQREAPELSLVNMTLTGDTMQLTAPKLPELVLPRAFDWGLERSVQIWDDMTVASEHAEGSAWFSRYLGGPHELVYMPDRHQRAVNPARGLASDIVSFADAYPFLLISEASLADLNARLEAPVTMARFRPNIVISGSEPYAEDAYAQVQIGGVRFRGPKRCDRCVVTTVDPDTGRSGSEPLRTLAKYRLEDQKVWFGINLIHDELGTLRVGDSVLVCGVTA